MVRNSLKIFIFIIFTSLIACQNTNNSDSNSTKVQKQGITAFQAIDLAEQFIKYQGYTSTKVNRTFKELQLEPTEYSTTPEGILKIRQNQLFNDAFGARKFMNGKKWAVGFEYTDQIENICRYVSMDSLGNNIKVETNDTNLSWFVEAVKNPELGILKKKNK